MADSLSAVIRCMRKLVTQSRVFFAKSLLQKKYISFLIVSFLAWPIMAATTLAQDDSPSFTAAAIDVSDTDSSAPSADPRFPQPDPGNPQANSNGTGATIDPDISWKHLPMRVLQDQKELWLFPTQLARGRHWVPTLAIIGVTGGLIAADPHLEPHFRNNPAFDETSEIFSTTNTGIVEAGVPAAIYLTGLLRHDSYTQETAILAGEAYLDSAIPHVVIKLISRRLRPSAVPASHDFRDTFFQSKVGLLGKGSSFPSGHAAAAFSIATVIARRYPSHKWVPWVAYGVAGVISFSRIPDMAHFPSDVFLGATLGYTITRYDVFRDRNR
jgi:membrane-associated phospholipid phosphatase